LGGGEVRERGKRGSRFEISPKAVVLGKNLLGGEQEP